MPRGYIKIWRRIRDSFVWQDAEYYKLFSFLLMEANYIDSEFIFNNSKMVLKRGQLITGRHQLSLETGISENKIYRGLELFEHEQLIEQQKTNRYTIVTIVCYNQYQENRQQNEQPVDSQQTASRQPVDTSKELIITKRTNNNIKRFKPPLIDEVKQFCRETQSSVDPETFFHTYESTGWVKANGQRVKNWKSTIRTWESRNNKSNDPYAGVPKL